MSNASLFTGWNAAGEAHQRLQDFRSLAVAFALRRALMSHIDPDGERALSAASTFPVSITTDQVRGTVTFSYGLHFGIAVTVAKVEEMNGPAERDAAELTADATVEFYVRARPGVKEGWRAITFTRDEVGRMYRGFGLRIGRPPESSDVRFVAALLHERSFAIPATH